MTVEVEGEEEEEERQGEWEEEEKVKETIQSNNHPGNQLRASPTVLLQKWVTKAGHSWGLAGKGSFPRMAKMWGQ